jgi:hypothetical protein
LLWIPALFPVLKWVKTYFALALSVATTGTAIIRTKTPEKDRQISCTSQANLMSLLSEEVCVFFAFAIEVVQSL